MNDNKSNQLIHSKSAINVIHRFHNKKFMLYVEGDDDIVFWDEHFRKYVPSDFYKIEQVHGKENLSRFIKGIKDKELNNVVVACDSDFTFFLETNPLDDLFIVRTYGHSIENTMFCPYSVATYIRRLSKSSENFLPEVEKWIKKFSSSAMKLLPYAIENEINRAKLPKVYNKGFRYFQNEHGGINIDENKINAYIHTIASNFDSDKILEIEQKIKKDDHEERHLIQGHFIAEATMYYIRTRVRQIKNKTVSLSNDAIYESIVDCKYECNPLCRDKLFLKSQIEKIYDYYYTL